MSSIRRCNSFDYPTDRSSNGLLEPEAFYKSAPINHVELCFAAEIHEQAVRPAAGACDMAAFSKT